MNWASLIGYSIFIFLIGVFYGMKYFSYRVYGGEDENDEER